jgi:hypothetical protein
VSKTGSVIGRVAIDRLVAFRIGSYPRKSSATQSSLTRRLVIGLSPVLAFGLVPPEPPHAPSAV